MISFSIYSFFVMKEYQLRGLCLWHPDSLILTIISFKVCSSYIFFLLFSCEVGTPPLKVPWYWHCHQGDFSFKGLNIQYHLQIVTTSGNLMKDVANTHIWIHLCFSLVKAINSLYYNILQTTRVIQKLDNNASLPIFIKRHFLRWDAS